MCKYIDLVKQFHETFNHPVNNYKDDIELKTRQLRVTLLFEELKELAIASDVLETFTDLCLAVNDEAEDKNWEIEDGNNVNKKEELDALCDIQYVLSGAALALGHHVNYEAAFDEVQESNMSKMCHDEKQVQDTINHYKEKGVDAYSVKKENGWLVLRTSDNKVLKNLYYKAVDISKYVS